MVDVADLQKNRLVCKKKLKVYSAQHQYDKSQPLCLTIGTFDGVHLGHQKILQNLVEYGKLHGYKTGLLTFEPHPRTIIGNNSELKLLTTLDEKKQLIFEIGIDLLFVKEFTKELSKLSAEEFVKQVLMDELHAKSLWVGHDHAFGKNREGNFNTLERLGKKYHFVVHRTPAVDVDQIPISSTKIRNLLLEGQIKKVYQMLGRRYSITGKTVVGRGVGSKIGFPTINLEYPNEKLLPKFGVYAVFVYQNENFWKGVANIGIRPTTGFAEPTLEIHLLDFRRKAYGETFKVEFVEFIREEKKFPSWDKLSEQIKQDVKHAEELLH